MGNGRVGTLALTTAMAATAAVLLAGPIRTLAPPAGPFRLPWPVLAALFAAAVLARVHIQFRREVHSVNLVELPLVLGLHLVGPLGLAEEVAALGLSFALAFAIITLLHVVLGELTPKSLAIAVPSEPAGGSYRSATAPAARTGSRPRPSGSGCRESGW